MEKVEQTPKGYKEERTIGLTIVVCFGFGMLVAGYFISGPDNRPRGVTATKEVIAARNALKSLRKLNSVTEIGVTFDQYSKKPLDIKIETDEAMQDIRDGEYLKERINQILNTYKDARDFWSLCLRRGREEYGRTYANFGKYELIRFSNYQIYHSEDGRVDSDQVGVIWAEASRQISSLEDSIK